MSNQPKQAEAISPEAIISIKVNGNFYARLHQLLMTISHEKSQEEFAKSLAEMKTREPIDTWEYNFTTILSLIYEIENEAKKQNQITLVDIPVSPKN